MRTPSKKRAKAVDRLRTNRRVLALAVKPRKAGPIRVYKFLSSDHALDNIKRRRIKISEIHDLSDPYELIPCDLSNPSTDSQFLRCEMN
jgi:hypothetical protein